MLDPIRDDDGAVRYPIREADGSVRYTDRPLEYLAYLERERRFPRRGGREEAR